MMSAMLTHRYGDDEDPFGAEPSEKKIAFPLVQIHFLLLPDNRRKGGYSKHCNQSDNLTFFGLAAPISNKQFWQRFDGRDHVARSAVRLHL